MDKIRKSDEEWRRSLTPEQYRILREKGTERPFTGQYAETNTPGVYLCAACGLELFASETKFDSGCGWPSFYDPLDKEHVEEHEDRSHGMVPHRGHLLPLRRPSRPRLSRRPAIPPACATASTPPPSASTKNELLISMAFYRRCHVPRIAPLGP